MSSVVNLSQIVFITAIFGDIPVDVDNLLHDSGVQEALLRMQKGKGQLLGESDKIKELEGIGLIKGNSLNFPLILKESFLEIDPEISLLANEIAELVYHGLLGLGGNSKEMLSIAALGELDVALDDVLLGRINALPVDSGQLIVCGFEGSESMAYRSTFSETDEGLFCTIEVGLPRSEVRSSIDASSPIFAGSDEMLDLAGSMLEWCLSEAETWAEDLNLKGLKRDMFIYGLTKLVYNRAMMSLSEEGKILWNVILKYTIIGL